MRHLPAIAASIEANLLGFPRHRLANFADLERKRISAHGNPPAFELIDRFTAGFITRFCCKDGAIDWDQLVAFNSGDPAAGSPCPPNSR